MGYPRGISTDSKDLSWRYHRCTKDNYKQRRRNKCKSYSQWKKTQGRKHSQAFLKNVKILNLLLLWPPYTGESPAEISRVTWSTWNNHRAMGNPTKPGWEHKAAWPGHGLRSQGLLACALRSRLARYAASLWEQKLVHAHEANQWPNWHHC